MKQKNITEGFKVMVGIKKFEGASETSMLRHSVGGWIHGPRSQDNGMSGQEIELGGHQPTESSCKSIFRLERMSEKA